MPPKRHHYIPQFFLERFCRDGIVWLFDRDVGEFRGQQPINTAVIKDYYTFADEDGNKNLEVEALLSRLESDARIVLAKVDQRRTLDEEDRQHLALFVAFQASRVPDFEKTVNEMADHLIKHVGKMSFATPERADALLDAFERDRPQAEPIDRERFREFILSNEYKIETHRSYVIALMLQVALEQARLFTLMNWFVFVPPSKKTYVLSDTPLSILAPRRQQAAWMGVGILTPGATKIVPLGPGACLVMGDRGEAFDYREVSEGLVREANLVTTDRCDRFVFARDELHLRSLVAATGIAARKRGPRIKFS